MHQKNLGVTDLILEKIWSYEKILYFEISGRFRGVIQKQISDSESESRDHTASIDTYWIGATSEPKLHSFRPFGHFLKITPPNVTMHGNQISYPSIVQNQGVAGFFT